MSDELLEMLLQEKRLIDKCQKLIEACEQTVALKKEYRATMDTNKLFSLYGKIDEIEAILKNQPTNVISNDFILDFGANTGGTSRIGTLVIAPVELVRIFGKPEEGDGEKVSGEYVFSKGDFVNTIYDYKMTSLYYGEGITPSEFWKQTNPEEFSIGGFAGENNANFLNWLKAKTGATIHAY